MVIVDVPGGMTFCIDSEETTNAMYAAWLASGASSGSWPAKCDAEGLGLEPTEAWPAPKDRADYPVIWVTWCQAHAYCEGDGKRLCGRLGGGSYAPSEMFSVVPKPEEHVMSEWVFACSAGGANLFSFGNRFVEGACNTEVLVEWDTLAAGSSFPQCEGGVPGLFQMTGNVFEYENACEDEPVLGACHTRGWLNGGGCEAMPLVNPSTGSALGETRPWAGIRCCADPTYVESAEAP